MLRDEQKGRVLFFGSNLKMEQATLDEVGHKAFGLMEMARIGLPIPAGFVLSTRFCGNYLQERTIAPDTLDLIRSGVRDLENATGLVFGGSRRPMLVAARSGAAVSMPGMMSTILNLGLCDTTVGGLVRLTGNPRFAWDSYRRLIQTYAEVVRGCSTRPFDRIVKDYLTSEKLESTKELDAESLRKLASECLQVFEKRIGSPFPQDPLEQLTKAVEAVFKSWESQRAVEYRRLHGIEGLIGTAVIIQTMIFGNMGSTSGSGIAFTRDPSNGENRLYIDFIFNAQGEDIVSGRHNVRDTEKLSRVLPGLYQEIQAVRTKLESRFKDMQDFEFTVQEGKFYILQCRSGKRTPWAALQIAVDLVDEGVIDTGTALKNLEGIDLSSISRTTLSPQFGCGPLCKGVAASLGVAAGEMVLDSEMAKRNKGRPLILVREETSTDDISGMAMCSGILTNAGGRTSHAAVLARQMGKVCIVGCRVLSINLQDRTCAFAGKLLREGDKISLDGNTGNVYEGKAEVVLEKPTKLLETVEIWKSQVRM